MRREHSSGDIRITFLVCLSLSIASVGCTPQDEADPGNERPESSESGAIRPDQANQPSIDEERAGLPGGERADETPPAAAEDDQAAIPDLTAGHEPTPESLEEVFERWMEMILDDDPAMRVAAVEMMAPRREDIAVLLPKHVEKVVRIYSLREREQKLRARRRTLNSLRSEQERLRSAEISVVDLGESGEAGRLRQTLEMMAAEAPVCGVRVRDGSGRGDDVAAFIYVNGRWAWWEEFDSLDWMIPRMTEEKLQKAEQRIAEKEASYAAEMRQAVEAAKDEEIGDVHYGLLVYMDQLDELVALGPAGQFVRAVHRKEGQKFPGKHENPSGEFSERFNARLQRFGRNLRQVISDEQRARFEDLVHDGYLFGVEAVPGSVSWRSSHGMAGRAGMQSQAGGRPGTRSWEYSKPPVPPADAFELPEASAAARILQVEDNAVRRKALQYLAKVDVDARCRQEILDALLAVQMGPPLKRPQHLAAVFTRWVTNADLDQLERLLVEGNLDKTSAMRVFLHMGKLDRQRAVEYINRRAADVARSRLADYKLAENTARLVIVQDKVLPDLLADEGYSGDFGVFEFDSTELNSLYSAIILALVESGEKDRMTYAANLVRDHFPALRAKVVPYLKNTKEYSYLYNMALRFESELRGGSN